MTNTPAAFREFQDKFVIVFVDDILVYNSDQESHYGYLQTVLSILCENQLYVKLSKCKFWLEKVTFLGHVIS